MKYVLLFTGGGMQGVFGGGVANRLEQENVYDNIEAIYASSAGVMTGAYFLAKQTKTGSVIYWDYLTKGFIHKKHFFPELFQRLLHNTKRMPRTVIDIDYLFDIIQHKKPLNVKAVQKSPIPFYACLINLDKNTIEYKDIRKNVLDTLRAGVSIVPYWHNHHVIDNTRYIDGAVAKPIGLADIQQRHPGKKIVVVLNSPEYQPSKITGIRRYLEGHFAAKIYGNSVKTFFKQSEQTVREDAAILTQDNVTVLHPKHNITRWCTNPKKLKDLFEEGREQAKVLFS